MSDRRGFELPDIGEGVAEAEVLEWLVAEGDAVSEDQPIVEVETDKAVVEIPSPYDATVAELAVDVGDVVPVGTVIAVYDLDAGPEGSGTGAGTGSSDTSRGESGTEVDASEEDRAGTGPGEGGEAAGAGSDAAKGKGGPGPTDAADSSGSESRLFAPPRLRRALRESGVDVSTVEGSGPEGQLVAADVYDALNQLKGPDPDGSGVSDGPEVPGVPEAPDGPESIVTRGAASAGPDPTASGAARDLTLALPATRRLARDLGVDIDAVPTAKSRDGTPYVTDEDVREYARSGEATARDATTSDARTGDTDARAEDHDRPVETVPYRGIRRTIGERMAESKFTAPQATLIDEVDVTRLVEAHAKLSAAAEAEGIRLTYLPFVLMACVRALEAVPAVNSELDEENGRILRKGYYDLGVATATDRGLLVPVVRDVDEKGLLALAEEVNEVVAATRSGDVPPERLRGGTFTVTNVGPLGGYYSTPILNYPEAAILSVGAIRRRPWVVDDAVVPRDVMPLSLTFDHRILDGKGIQTFVNEVKDNLADPTRCLL